MKRRTNIALALVFCLFALPRISSAEEALIWEDCIKEAASNNPDLIAAEENIKQSQATKAITASSLFPQIDADLNASTAQSASRSSTTGKIVKTISDSYSFGVSGTQLIFDGFKTYNSVRAAVETIQASRQNYKFTSATVRYRLRSAFIDLLRAQEMLRITAEIFDIRRDNFELITLRYQSGLEHKGALLTSDADLADAKLGISQAKRNLEVAVRNMMKEMGRTKFTAIEVKGDFKVMETAEKKPDFDLLVVKNPSLQQIIAQKNSAEFNLKSTYGNFSPVLSGQAGADKSDKRWNPRGNEWNLGLTLSMPIFEGGLRVAQVNQAKSALNQLKENERSTRDGIVLTLEQTWAVLQDAMENVKVQNKVLIATQERSKIAQAQYSTGFVTFDNWIIIEDNLVKAKKTFLDAQASALLAEADWIQAKGETLEYEK